MKREGVKAPKLSDLNGRDLTLADISALTAAFENESDRGMSLLYAALAENAVEWAIYRRLPGLGEAIRKNTFMNENAPLATFSRKIAMGRAMGIYGEETEVLLKSIKNIRNKFAHLLLPIAFETPEIKNECFRLKIPGGLVPLPHKDNARTRYKLAVNWLYASLMENAVNQTRTFNIDLP